MDTTIQACLQSRLGNTKFAQNLQTTLICKTAKTSFKLYLVTVQNLERHNLDNLLALRGLLHTADQCKLKVPKKLQKRKSTIENEDSDTDNDKSKKSAKTPETTSETNSEQKTTDPAAQEPPTTPIAHLRLNFSSLQTQVTSLRSKNALFSKSATNNSASSASTKPHANFNQVIQKFDNLLKYVNSESDSDQKNSSSNTTASSTGNAFTSLFRKNTNTSTSSNFNSKSPVQDLLQQIDSFFDAYFTPYQRSELYARYQFKYRSVGNDFSLKKWHNGKSEKMAQSCVFKIWRIFLSVRNTFPTSINPTARYPWPTSYLMTCPQSRFQTF